jgi:hypothetical protein
MLSLNSLDELHVVSDLHMGGADSGQIFDEGERFGQWLEHVRSTAPEKSVAVCLNGDTVDFPAEPGASYFDGLSAVAKLERIIADRAFAPVWKALKRLVRTKRRTLVLTLGNHDLELALPWVRERLLMLLSGGDDAARGRIRLAFDGAGFLARVGAARVLCIHGNDVDPWNRTDYEALRRQGRDGLLGRALLPWSPNPGTKLVSDVMHEIKAEFPFVDLLKPATEAVVPILYALQPSLQSKLDATLAEAARGAWEAVRHELGFLATGSKEQAVSPGADSPGAEGLERLLRATFRPACDLAAKPRWDPLVVEAERQFRAGVEPMSLLAGADAGARLERVEAAGSWITNEPPSEMLRAALSGWAREQSFAVNHADETFRRLDEFVAPGVEFVVAGHTHLARAVPRRGGRGAYYNCGTWARRIQLSPDILSGAEQFARCDRAFRAGTLAALDGEPGLVLRRRTIVSITAAGGRTRGKLVQCEAGPGVDLRLVEGSELGS